MKRLLALSCLLAGTTLSYADNLLYGNNADFGSPYVYQIDKTTGAVLNTYSNLSGNNGRGVVVVGDTMYYTSASTNSIFSYTLSTHTNNGAVFSIPGASGLSTIAYDGTNFYIGDYSGTNAVYEYTPTGTLLNTLHLQNCTGYCDGLEYFIQNGTGYLVENRGDSVGPYDLYNLDGTLKTADFIPAPPVGSSGTTGIAFDGTDFYTSNIFQGSLSEWDINGAFVRTFNITGTSPSFPPLVEDLSADYSQVLPPPNPNPIPEPSSFILLGSGAVGLAGALRRKLRA